MSGINLSDAEKCYIVHGVQDDMRNDGRACEEYRSIELETGLIATTNGSSRLRLGNTELLTGVKVELGTPNPHFPKEGWIEFHVDCSPNASPSFQGRGGQNLSNNICNHLSRIYANKGVLDLSKLGILPFKYCWVVHVDVLILECGGNLFDSVSVAVKAALFNTGIPNIKIIAGDEGEAEIILPDDPLDSIYMDTAKCPILVTVNKIGNRHIIDATEKEELCCNASIVLGVTKRGLITGMRKIGHGSLDPESISEMVETGKSIGQKIHQSLNKLLALEKGMSKDGEKSGYLEL